MFVVFEGIDGSGKTTQIELLKKYYARKASPFKAISFPSYGENIYANLVKDYLEGKFGDVKKVDPYLISLAYAGDRNLAKPQIEKWLKSGKLVIANRYVSSNKAHLGTRVPDNEKESFFKWLDQLEYQTNGMPKEDLTILLKVDPIVGQENALKDHQVDIHEKSTEHQQKAAQIYLELSKKEKNWAVVNCMEDGKMKPKEEIFQQILKILHE